uniref:Reverse transcriptase domain-containing protein n=1 Tax=Esox lucius TaxID=8010 RepID=A0A6Q2XJZ7_ESOLU
ACGLLRSFSCQVNCRHRLRKHINAIKNMEGDFIINEKEKSKVVKETFSMMYTNIEPDEIKITEFLKADNHCFNILFRKINRKVEDTIKQLSVGKSPGPDGLPSEFYKCHPNPPLLKVFQVLLAAERDQSGWMKQGMLHETFYQGVMTLLYKKNDEYDLSNWRHLTMMNLDYKIFAKVVMNRLNDVLENIIEKEQTCAIKGRLMWDNLCLIREIIYSPNVVDVFIIGLDQKKAFDYISREYVWKVLEWHGFPDEFINMVKLLYIKSTVQVNVNGELTESFNVERGVKQGCPLSAALYVLAMSQLLKLMKNDKRIKGVSVGTCDRVVTSAYADDITVFIHSQKELNTAFDHFKLYEKASGAKLNEDKTEGILLGNENRKPPITIEIKDEIRLLGIYISGKNCAKKNWNRKEIEVKQIVEKWSNKNVKSRIQIIYLFILSKLIFLSVIFPPTEYCIIRLNKMCVNLGNK